MSKAIMRRLFVVLAATVLFLAVGPGRATAATSDCPRNCEVWAYGYAPAPAGSVVERWGHTFKIEDVKDPSFNRAAFLERLGSVFSASRLRLDTKQSPEYSLTATFHKFVDEKSGRPLSLLIVILGFNGGRTGSGTGNQGTYDRVFRAHYHGSRLLTWATWAQGHDLAAHGPLMAAEVSAAKINETLTACEQVPVDVELEETPYWCDQGTRSDPVWIKLSSFQAAAEKLSAMGEMVYDHHVRIVVRAERGKIENGSAVDEDPKARVFKIHSQEIGDRRSRVQIEYRLPDGEDNSDVITVYNSCEIRYESVIPLSETKKGSMLLEIENQCGWEGTLTMSETMEAGEKESLLAALTPGGEYDISKSWGVRFKLKREGDNAGRFRYAVDEARLLSFKEALEATLFRMEREGRRIESTSRQTATSRGRGLSSEECGLQFIVDTEKGTYRLWGKIDVQGISIQGRDEIEIKVKPVDEKHGEGPGGTTGIDESIDISGKFDKSQTPEGVPEELKGRKDLMQEVPSEFREFLEDMGGKQKYVQTWELKRKAVRVTKG